MGLTLSKKESYPGTLTLSRHGPPKQNVCKLCACSKYFSLYKLRELSNGPVKWAYTYTLRGLLKPVFMTGNNE